MSTVSARLDAESDAASGIGQHTHHVVDMADANQAAAQHAATAASHDAMAALLRQEVERFRGGASAAYQTLQTLWRAPVRPGFSHPISDASVAKTDSRAAVLPWLGYNLELLFEPEPPLPS
ncbi:MAG: hypothetical protein U1E47_02975 [Rivihabitans pingtungensis]